MRGRSVLTTLEFDVMWERLGLGPTPVVLRLAAPGHGRTAHRELRTAGWAALRERGLAGPSGPDPELVRLLRLLAGPAEQLELRGWWGRDARAVAAARAGTGVLAVAQDATVTLEPCGGLAAALLGVLPPAGRTPGHARIVALATDRWGVARRSGGVVGVLDTPRGRCITTSTGVTASTEVTTSTGAGAGAVEPVDEPGLHRRLTALLAQARAAVELRAG